MTKRYSELSNLSYFRLRTMELSSGSLKMAEDVSLKQTQTNGKKIHKVDVLCQVPFPDSIRLIRMKMEHPHCSAAAGIVTRVERLNNQKAILPLKLRSNLVANKSALEKEEWW